MKANYNKLWKLLIDKGMSKTALRIKTKISSATLAKLSKNEMVSMDILLRICGVLDCNIGDIMDVAKDEANIPAIGDE
jgi:DNA-binding Xre family transcriptional regulator